MQILQAKSFSIFLDEEMKKSANEVQLTVRVPADFYARWTAALEADDRKQTQVLRMLTRRYVEEIEALASPGAGPESARPKRQIIKSIDAAGSAVNISRRKREDVRG